MVLMDWWGKNMLAFCHYIYWAGFHFSLHLQNKLYFLVSPLKKVQYIRHLSLFSDFSKVERSNFISIQIWDNLLRMAIGDWRWAGWEVLHQHGAPRTALSCRPQATLLSFYSWICSLELENSASSRAGLTMCIVRECMSSVRLVCHWRDLLIAKLTWGVPSFFPSPTQALAPVFTCLSPQ